MTTASKPTISEIKAANKAAGFFFFERATMRFFRSKVERGVYAGPGGVFFVTSEQFTPSSGEPYPRLYKVRQFHPETGSVTSPFPPDYRDIEDARDLAKGAAKHGY